MSLPDTLWRLLMQRADDARDAAAVRVARASKATRRAGDTHQSLLDYAAQRQLRRRARTGTESDSGGLALDAEFGVRLGEAVDTQRAQVEQLARSEAELRADLAERQRQTRALEVLAQRRLETARKRLDRLGRRDEDEIAARAGPSPGARYPHADDFTEPNREE